MDKKDREKINQQLVAQAARISKEEDNVRIAMDSINTCQALLRIVEKNITGETNETEFEDILSGYVGVASRVGYFYQNNSEYFASGESKLKTLVEDISRYQRQKTELDTEYEKKMDEVEAAKNEVAYKTTQLDTVTKTLGDTQEAVKKLEADRNDTVAKVEALEKEEKRLQDELNNFESMMETLSEAIERLNEQNKELIAHYAEFGRIKEGIAADGYVDINDFTNKINNKIEEGNELMKWYDTTLKRLLTDVEAVQKTIESRRKAGV